MQFKHDQQKAKSNLKKHGIDFSEAETVFADPFALTFFDKAHSENEYRYFTLGISEKGKYLAIWHTENDSEVRIIGAREMDKTERTRYDRQR